MDNRGNERFLFLVGLLTGVGVGFFLTSERGKELRQQADQRLREFGDDVSTRAQHTAYSATQNVESALEQSKTYVDQFADSVKKGTDASAKAVDSIIDEARKNFISGLEKAQKVLEERRKNASNQLEG